MEKLTLENIACYLPHEFKFISELDKPKHEYGKNPIHTANGIIHLFGDYCLNSKELNDAYPVHLCQLILRPMSDYTNINGKAMSELNCDLSHQMEICDLANGIMGYWNISHGAVQVMQKNFIDYQGLIEKSLAIDVNTLETNPYNN